MYSIKKGADSAVIVIHEIYGLNQHMKSFCQSLSSYGVDVFCPNLLGPQKSFEYSNEKDAYDYFINHVGFTHAKAIIKQLLREKRDHYQKIFLVGFSIGATVAWLCSELELIDGIVGYYGSRIRNYTTITPYCPTLLFFAGEKSFAVDDLVSVLVKKNKVRIIKLSGQHGFSDPFSTHYHAGSAENAFHEMVAFLEI